MSGHQTSPQVQDRGQQFRHSHHVGDGLHMNGVYREEQSCRQRRRDWQKQSQEKDHECSGETVQKHVDHVESGRVPVPQGPLQSVDPRRDRPPESQLPSIAVGPVRLGEGAGERLQALYGLVACDNQPVVVGKVVADGIGEGRGRGEGSNPGCDPQADPARSPRLHFSRLAPHGCRTAEAPGNPLNSAEMDDDRRLGADHGRKDSETGQIHLKRRIELLRQRFPGRAGTRGPPLSGGVRPPAGYPSPSSQPATPPRQTRAFGPSRLLRRMNQIAATPSLHPIFFPSA